MKTITFNTLDAVFNFNQKEVMEFLICHGSDYDLEETVKLLEHISTGNKTTIVIPEEPVFFDSIALNLITTGHGSALCKTCNKTYLAGQLKSIQVESGGSPLDIEREKKGIFNCLFSKKHKPPTMNGERSYECPVGHSLISVITWKTF